ncbi:MAG TPA: Rossmann-like fold-containing protein [Ktedonobacteraceae bacterium]|nr:Rossmann-like fold-containing protein [Ktedonobacteraceae bacterium]
MRVILYGCGDFSYVIEYLQEALNKLGKPAFTSFNPNDTTAKITVDVVATELRSEDQLVKQYGQRVKDNIAALQKMGIQVLLGVDATNHPYYGPFDLVIFRNPHTGNYGNSQDPSMLSYVESIGKNNQLFEGVLKKTEQTVVPYGEVLITVVGWPYVGKNPKTSLEMKGLNLDNPTYAKEYGSRAGLEFLSYIDFGTHWIARNSGGSFEAGEIGLHYRDNTKWRDVKELEHTMRGYEEKNWPAWVYKHDQWQAIKYKINNNL